MHRGSTGQGCGYTLAKRRGGAWRGCVLLLLLALGLAAGCSSPPPESHERLGVASQAVNGGTVDTTGQYSAVVGVFLDGTSYFATGVALSDRVVATAAHLVGPFLRDCDGFVYGQASSPSSQPSTGL